MARVERWPDRLADVIGAGRGEQESLRLRPVAIVLSAQEKLANGLGAVASARLAGEDHSDSALAQGRRERLCLRGLADALPAFETDEAAAGVALTAIPNSCLNPSQMRPKKPALPTSSPATSGVTCGCVSPVNTSKSAMCWPLVIGAVTALDSGSAS